MDGGGEWKNKVWADSCSVRGTRLQSQGVGARPWILERRKGLARGIYNRLAPNDRFVGKQILAEAQWSWDTLISGGGYSAYQLVFGPNLADLYGRGDED